YKNKIQIDSHSLGFMISKYGLGLCTSAVASWLLGYKYMTNEVTKSSSLIKQTLFNLESNSRIVELLGRNLEIASSVEGPVNQFKGAANIEFKCVGTKGIYPEPHIFFYIIFRIGKNKS